MTTVNGSIVRLLAKRLTAAHARPTKTEPTVRTIYEEHARFVWLSLQRLGVEATDLDDLAHDVFVVVHRRLGSFDGSSRMTTWLFGICMRLAANYRRRRRRAASEAAIQARAHDDPTEQAGTDEMIARRQERAIAERILAELSLERRAVFMMFEIEGLSCQEISVLTGVPIGTIYSRLYAARREIERIVSAGGPEGPRGTRGGS